MSDQLTCGRKANGCPSSQPPDGGKRFEEELVPGRESDCREGQGVKSVDRADAFAVEARSISKSYRSSRRGRRRTTVFRDVSVQVEPGEVVGITGPSGAGKSTLLYCLSGLEPVDSGDVLVQGSDMTHCSRGARAAVRRKCMGFIFQEYNLVDSLTVLGNVELASRMAGMGRQRDAVLSTLERVGMTAFLDAYPDELSGGQQQRVAVARALVLNPPDRLRRRADRRS